MGSCNPWRSVGRTLRLLFGTTTPFASVVAQCGIAALPSIPFAGVDATVVASVNWDQCEGLIIAWSTKFTSAPCLMSSMTMSSLSFPTAT